MRGSDDDAGILRDQNVGGFSEVGKGYSGEVRVCNQNRQPLPGRCFAVFTGVRFNQFDGDFRGSWREIVNLVFGIHFAKQPCILWGAECRKNSVKRFLKPQMLSPVGRIVNRNLPPSHGRRIMFKRARCKVLVDRYGT